VGRATGLRMGDGGHRAGMFLVVRGACPLCPHATRLRPLACYGRMTSSGTTRSRLHDGQRQYAIWTWWVRWGWSWEGERPGAF
jgi:hypothetical protein